MTLKELYDYVIIHTAQYEIGDDIELNENIIRVLSNTALALYGQYRPAKNTSEYTFKTGSQLVTEIDGRIVTNITEIWLYDPLLAGSNSTPKYPFGWSYDTVKKELKAFSGGTYWIEYWSALNLEQINYNDNDFLELVVAKSLQYLGGTRKSFVLNDLPYETDGADIHSLGKEMEENIITRLGEVDQRWFIAVR